MRDARVGLGVDGILNNLIDVGLLGVVLVEGDAAEGDPAVRGVSDGLGDSGDGVVTLALRLGYGALGHGSALGDRRHRETELVLCERAPDQLLAHLDGGAGLGGVLVLEVKRSSVVTRDLGANLAVIALRNLDGNRVLGFVVDDAFFDVLTV